MSIKLTELGWHDFFAEHLPTLAEDETPARVVGVERNQYHVWATEGILQAQLAGRFFHEDGDKDFPALGDWVVVRPIKGEDKVIVTGLLERKSCFSRAAVSGHVRAHSSKREEQIIATNIDYIFIVMGLDNDFNLRRLERYLAAALGSGATPVVILNKADLCIDQEEKAQAVRQISNADVHVTSAFQDDGVRTITHYLKPGVTVALAGSSGVGKSTLINRLLGENRAATGAVRDFDGKGRHTTTRREFFLLPQGGILIDNPGIRELMAWQTNTVDAFEDITRLAALCHYRNCSHRQEDGCAVSMAVKRGELDKKRVRNFLKLQQEAAEVEVWMGERDVLRQAGRKRRDGIRSARQAKGKA